MRQVSLAAMAAVVLGAGLGCSPEQSASVTTIFTQAKASGKQSAAAGLASSALTAQQTLYYLANAFAQAASVDLQGEELSAVGGFGKADTQLSYELDTEKGTGKVTGLRGGKQVVDLSFTYEKEHGNAGMAYTVTGTTGHVEGYRMFFPRLTLLYTIVLGTNFQPERDAKGNALFNVSLDATGSFGVGGTETMRLSKTTLNLTYPLAEGEAKAGTIVATSSDGLRFEGELWSANKAFKLKGTIQDAAGQVTHLLETTPSGEAGLQPAGPAPRPTASVAP